MIPDDHTWFIHVLSVLYRSITISLVIPVDFCVQKYHSIIVRKSGLLYAKVDTLDCFCT